MNCFKLYRLDLYIQTELYEKTYMLLYISIQKFGFGDVFERNLLCTLHLFKNIVKSEILWRIITI